MDIDMERQLVRYVGNEQGLAGCLGAIEQVIFHIGDAFQIRIQWESDSALLAGTFALVGGLVGGLAGGRLGATIGAGLGSVAGLTTSNFITLRELWTKAKETLTEIFFIVINFLRRFDALDYLEAISIVLTSFRSKQELAIAIVSFLTQKLGREVMSSLSNNGSFGQQCQCR